MKPIPPYKPIANEAHNSDSEKEPETGSSKNHISPPAGKKRATVAGKATPSKASNKSNSSQQKTFHNNKNSDKTKVSNTSSSSANKSDKSADSTPTSDSKVEKKDQKSGETLLGEVLEKEVVKDNKIGKKRKVNSRTPTPVSASVIPNEISVAVTPVTTAASLISSTTVSADINKSTVGDTSAEKAKKV